MKKITTLLLIVFIVGCNVDSNGNKRPKDYGAYKKEFHKYLDSHHEWFEKFMCYYRCANRDSMEIAGHIMDVLSDSSDKYYALMYPYGNPAAKKEPEEKDNCNCETPTH